MNMTAILTTAQDVSYPPREPIRLICFPYSGGNSSLFRSWQCHAPCGLRIWPVQIPGRGERLQEGAQVELRPLVEQLASELTPVFQSRFALFGYSMGALIAFELARLLEVRLPNHRGPELLIVAARGSPSLPDHRPTTFDLPEEDFVNELRRLKGTPTELLDNAELMQLMLPTVRADFQLVQTYRYHPGPRLRCPILAMGAAADLEVEVGSAERLETGDLEVFRGGTFSGGSFLYSSLRRGNG
jgi:medium-chain acyl-[acyl-carrier-protein] hydrolase